MRRFINKQNFIGLIWTIALAIFLRSLIAPGYMLDPVSSDNAGLNIIVCHGLASIYAPPSSGGHKHHHGEHNGQEQHYATPSCGFWTTSGLFIVSSQFQPASFFINKATIITEQRLLTDSYFFANTYPIRAPPTLS